MVSEYSEYWWPKADRVICSYFGEREVGRERGRAGLRVCVIMTLKDTAFITHIVSCRTDKISVIFVLHNTNTQWHTQCVMHTRTHTHIPCRLIICMWMQCVHVIMLLMH